MKAVVWHGRGDVRVDQVPDPVVQEPNDIVIKVTSSGICGSDLHLYEVFGPFMTEGDILGHEAMGVVLEVGSEITNVKPGDRVVIPFNISCGYCEMCRTGLMSQCETTQVRAQGKGAALFGYTKLYGRVPGGQAEFLRVPQAQFGPIVVPQGAPDDRFVYLSDVLPTAWQAVEYAQVPAGGSVAVLGLGPIGDMATRVAMHQDAGQVIGVDLVPERLARAQANGVTTVDLAAVDDAAAAIRDLTGGRGPDAVIDAVGMEAHGSPVAKVARQSAGLLPDAIGGKVMETAGVDQTAALRIAIDAVRRGGTISLSGVYGGMADPQAYAGFQATKNGTAKVLLKP
jgi:threonine dehydrogenase-like Zn-dependent dehydrogenase